MTADWRWRGKQLSNLAWALYGCTTFLEVPESAGDVHAGQYVYLNVRALTGLHRTIIKTKAKMDDVCTRLSSFKKRVPFCSGGYSSK